MALLQPATTLAVLAAGIALGYAGYTAPSGVFDPLLVVLVFAAGLAIGGQLPGQRMRLRSAGLQGLLLAVATLVSSAASAAVVAAVTGLAPPRPAAAIGAAAGWYSLAGPALARIDPGLGVVAFLANLFRESLHIALYPALARRGLRLQAIAVGGATTMDTGLPVVALHGGAYEAAVALVHGVALTLAAPAAIALLAG
ncbi:LysO family transporter [Pyrodictium abyssi]|uniref:Lysine exporter LysO family protein n=1 Tax=Pyrodictium abyssi TaxID=54256 RepID=A0ABM8IXS4_9CREN|nr:lysine exporter LysO family protein [Pyrodictium abyssi]